MKENINLEDVDEYLDESELFRLNKKAFISLLKHRLKIPIVARTETTDSQTISSVFLARVINCFCSSELVRFFFPRLYFS